MNKYDELRWSMARTGLLSLVAAIIIGVLLLLSGCGTTAKVGLHHKVKDGLYGNSPVVIVQVEAPVTKDISCGWTHLSHLTEGKPFNNRREDSMDSLGCTYKAW